MDKPASSTTAEIYVHAHEHTAILRHYTLQKFENDLLMSVISFLNVHTWKAFSITSTIFIKIMKVQSCKLCNNKYMIASTQTTNIEIFAFIAILVFSIIEP